uniref:BACK domain-containing protein n=1 Tax=Parastrongyloides trichosuri TaxID=131310 RepID=A0A0N4ZQZ8_PARTI
MKHNGTNRNVTNETHQLGKYKISSMLKDFINVYNPKTFHDVSYKKMKITSSSEYEDEETTKRNYALKISDEIQKYIQTYNEYPDDFLPLDMDVLKALFPKRFYKSLNHEQWVSFLVKRCSYQVKENKKPLDETVLELIDALDIDDLSIEFIIKMLFQDDIINSCEEGIIKLFLNVTKSYSKKYNLPQTDVEKLPLNVDSVEDLTKELKGLTIERYNDGLEVVDDSPEVLFSKRIKQVGDYVYIFGGMDNNNEGLKEILRWNITESHVTISKEFVDSLSLYGGECFYYKNNNCIYLFGGYEDSSKGKRIPSTAIRKYDIEEETLTYERLHLKRSRFNFFANPLPRSVLLIGGYNLENDICTKMEWIVDEKNGFVLRDLELEVKYFKYDAIRRGVVCGGNVYVIGRRFDDIYLVHFDPKQREEEWEEIKIEDLYLDSNLIRYNEKIICTGGTNKDGIVQKTAFMINIYTHEIEYFHDLEHKRRNHGSFIFNESLYIFGGSDEENLSVERLNLQFPSKWLQIPFKDSPNRHSFAYAVLF